MNAREITRLIGAVSYMADREPRRHERKRLRRLVKDLCTIAEAIRELERERVESDRVGSRARIPAAEEVS